LLKLRLNGALTPWPEAYFIHFDPIVANELFAIQIDP
jgi:hypothetical protein